MTSTSDRAALYSALAVCAAFFAGVFGLLSLDSDPFDHGDTHTDLRAIIAAQQFERVGVSRLHCLQTEDGGPEIGLSPWFYPRHPGMGAVVLALFRRAGLSIGAARSIPLLVSTLGVFCMFLFFRAATANAWIGVLGAAAYATLSPVWLLADSFLINSGSPAGKAATLWLVAAGCNARGAGRWLRFGAAGMAAAACITLCGLETMPSTGILAFLLPLVLIRDPALKRFMTALGSAALAGIGMAAGFGVRFWNMAQAHDGNYQMAWTNFSESLKHRSSLSGVADDTLDLPYPIELLRRVWIYAPHVFGLLAVALAVTLVVRVRTGRWPYWPGLRVLAVGFVAEGLYFVAMRNHATEHFHTLILLTLTLSAAVTSTLALLAELLPRVPQWVESSGTAAVLLLAVWIAPLPGGQYGNLHPTFSVPARKFIDEASDQARLLPPHSVVIVVGEGDLALACGGSLVLQGHTFVRTAAWNRGWDRVLDRARASGRPVFAMIPRDGPRDFLAEVASKGRPITSGRFKHVYALANYDRATLPGMAWTMDDATLKQTAFTSPTVADLAAAGVKYPYFGPTGAGVWLLAPQERLEARATVGIVPFRPDPGFQQPRAAICVFHYERRPNLNQPPAVAGFRVRPKPSGADSRGDLSSERTLAPGETVELQVAIPDGVEVVDFEIWARRPDGQKSNTGAALNCTEIRFQY